MKQKRLIISAPSGGSGKTLTSLGLARALVDKGEQVLPFKKGPDYIDSAWLALAAKQNTYNLDPFFLDKQELQAHFLSICKKSSPNSIALIEGNRGLFDGKDIFGSSSTAELATILETPVILTFDAKKSTRTLAALINGMLSFDKRISFLGVIINNIASARHEKTIADCINYYCDTPLLGFMPRFKENPIPERHLGLNLEIDEDNEKILSNLGEVFANNIDIPNILELLNAQEEISYSSIELPKKEELSVKKAKIGYIKDKAFWFYYTENLESLENEGVELVPLSMFADKEDLEKWNEIDALYIGGGYPEVYAKELSHSPYLQKIKELAENNFPIYAECGGFMLLTRSIADTEQSYNMAGIFDIDLEFHVKPQGLGYIEGAITSNNPFFQKDTALKGHEFHYSIPTNTPKETHFSLSKGVGMGGGKDALLYRNTFASYTHIYSLTHKEWAKNFVTLAVQYKESRA